MSEFTPTIGLEVHIELKTRTKMFCSSANDPAEKRPNVNVCPVCLAHPGTLPVINRQAVVSVLRVGAALGGKIAGFAEFDRKSYFYPDLPKGYQISQYQNPLVRGGELRGVKITRIHLEEDTARSQHDSAAGDSLIDFNRAGVPLMELVTEPVIASASEAVAFARELQLILRYLGVAEANMEKGEMRVEANISVNFKAKSEKENLGTKVEVKNLNSFRAVERAIGCEIERQRKILAAGGKVLHETRGWDETKEETFTQRQKEFSHDYRYFPDPDLPPLRLDLLPEFTDLAKSLPELPEARRERYRRLGLRQEETEGVVAEPALAGFFDAVAADLAEDRQLVIAAANWLTNDIVNLLGGNFSLLARFAALGELVRLIAAGEVSSRGAKEVLAQMLEGGGDPRQIVKDKKLFQKSDEGELAKIVDQVIAAYSKVTADYQAGKQAALQFLVGQGMKASKGAANPAVLQKLFREKLG